MKDVCTSAREHRTCSRHLYLVNNDNKIIEKIPVATKFKPFTLIFECGNRAMLEHIETGGCGA